MHSVENNAKTLNREHEPKYLIKSCQVEWTILNRSQKSFLSAHVYYLMLFVTFTFV